MRYAQIRKMDISNGEGIGVALFVQGCHFHCKNCFNQETWDFNGGKLWTAEVKNKFMELVSRPYVKRVSILGGEPLVDENVKEVLELVLAIKSSFPEKKIWLYTGYTIEAIIKKRTDFPNTFDKNRWSVMLFIDVMVDGEYVDELQDFNLKWKGSSNQRVIDMERSWRNIDRAAFENIKDIKLIEYKGRKFK